ncbi:tetratricopeptide repeat protein [Curvivirga aplysinae]|uniref:tetratricopeptide repeat protein n=1 Tax=Curvivirga aplysinae TaxID=2529852 RepID=UPI001C3FBAAD|nr:tetratricopeptide repeat protein [Curvivirga aplysinae]
MLFARAYSLISDKSSGILSRVSIIASFLLATNFTSAYAETTDVDFTHNQSYRGCIILAHKDAERAFETALSWEDEGGGLPARHCASIALFNLEHYQEAAERLQQLAKDMPETVSPQIVADILGQAGLALYTVEDYGNALEVQTAALKLHPENITLLIDRALTQMELGKGEETIKDLSDALKLETDNLEALTYRGSAYRIEEKFDLALIDLNRVLALEPTNPEALLERGIVYRLQNNKEAARTDWLKLIEYHDGRPAADMAQRNLQKMELGEE